MKLYRKSIADFAWDVVFAIAALRWRKIAPPPAKPYNQADEITNSLTKIKGAKR